VSSFRNISVPERGEVAARFANPTTQVSPRL
jgi:hypothetical protein